MLQNKSLVELRGIAQSFGIANIFQMDAAQLRQQIELKQQGIAKPEPIVIPTPAYDARLMTEQPGKICELEEVEELLAPYVQRGLHARFDDERWYFSHGKKTDEGTLRMPVRIILKCAEAVLK